MVSMNDGPRSRPLRVLLVEDVESDAVLLLQELRRGAYEVAHLRVDTLDAVKDALDTGGWDLVISDYCLPSLTVMEVLEAVRGSGIDVPCIVISGTIEEETAVQALRAGARDFVVKHHPARLLPAIARELHEAEERRRKRAFEAALDDARDRMRFALESAGVGTWEVDLVTGTSVWSDVLEGLHGLPAGGFGGTFDAFLRTVHPEDRRHVSDRFTRSIANDSEWTLEYRTVWSDGSTHWISAVGRAFYADAGRPVRAAGIGLDITSRKHLEDRLRQSQKMEAIGQLAGGVAHDFNNVLTAILGFCHMLLENDDPDSSQRADLLEIEKAGQRAAALTRQLLAFSRHQVLQPKVLDANRLVRGIEPMLRRLVFENIELSLTLRPEAGLIKIDPTQFEQILVNLVVNARDAMPRGGTLTIATERARLDGRDHAGLIVQDTGVGMDDATTRRIFEPFFTTKGVGKGTGLGLATVYGIVKQSGGDIAVSSEPGRGSAFRIYLPNVPPVTAEVIEHAFGAALPRGSETILIVEDDAAVRRLASITLKRSGYNVLEAGSPREAEDVSRRHVAPIHLLLSDVVMPDSDGPPLIDRLRTTRPGLRLLYMSGYAGETVVKHGISLEDTPFMQKPFTRPMLAEKVREVLDT
jgi:hypothetical protein